MALTAGITLLVTTIVYSLLIATAYELLTIGEPHSAPNSTPTTVSDRILQTPVWYLYGLFASGLVIILWPLAVLHHKLFFMIRDRQHSEQ